MTSAILLGIWMILGVGAAAALPVPSQSSRWGWAPMAAILGPLWVSIAFDQRATARAQPDLVTARAAVPDEHAVRERLRGSEEH